MIEKVPSTIPAPLRATIRGGATLRGVGGETVAPLAKVIKTAQELQMLSNVTLNCQAGSKDCHEFRFSFVRIVITVSNVTSL